MGLAHPKVKEWVAEMEVLVALAGISSDNERKLLDETIMAEKPFLLVTLN